ncbi:MAG: AMP-binding protein, partial [Streptosporangiaceae bacterium]
MPESGKTETLLSVLPRRDEHPALIDPVSGVVLSHRRLHAEISSVAAQLAGLDIGAGDRVAMVLPNSLELVTAFLAIASLGAAVAPLNPAFTANEIAAEVGDLRTGMILFGRPAEERVRGVAGEQGLACHLLGTGADGRVTVDGGPTAAAPAGTLAGTGADPDAIVLLLHTSGTTSRPKTVPLRQRNLAHTIRAVGATYRLGPQDVSYCVMPLFHIHGLVAATFAALAAGGAVIVPPKFSAATFWDDVKRLGATWYTAVPTIHQIVLAACAGGRQAGHGLRFARSCSSTLPPP